MCDNREPLKNLQIFQEMTIFTSTISFYGNQYEIRHELQSIMNDKKTIMFLLLHNAGLYIGMPFQQVNNTS